ncbi:MAG: ATP-dependent Clp protease ATP-binding subunit, partial [Patescibacteria group bacterium]|nr:ATP-dependent Clp protease ATP-binding subunit [Patescibacteria group bacterium]
DVIVFHALDRSQQEQIAKLLLSHVKQLVKAQGMSIEFTDLVVNRIANIGYEPEFGARPMKRAIQTEIENTLSSLLLKGKFKKGAKISADVKDGKVVFTKA